MRILFVDNQETFARVVIGAFLGCHDVAVRTSLSGAIEELGACDYDAVLISFEIEDGSGIEIVRYIRDTGREVLVIGISAKEEENAQLVAAGADDACSKMHFDRIGRVLQKYTK